MAGDSARSHASPEKRLKALIPFPIANTKSGVENESAEREFQQNRKSVDDKPCRICVICLSEDGKAERGKLDSCDHYFCFVCIMEWARIESRCPACKGRFTTVHRIPKVGCLLHERIVKVPIRNQVHSPFGNATSEPYDPYAETNCNICKGMEDEGLMLLCDLCDSAAHTYCVGLGANVPEGDWFCPDCTISRAQHANTETDTSGNDQNQIATVEAHISSDCEGPSIAPSRRSRVAHKSSASCVDKATGTNARTLHRCRDIHNHIRALRENWDALRRGSLSFPSSSSTSSGNSSKQNVHAALNNRTGQRKFSTPRNFQQSSKPVFNKNSYDVEKAWKMMEIAKAKAIHERTRNIDQTLRYPTSRGINTREKNTASSCSHTVKSPQYKIKELCKPAMNESYSLKKEIGKHRSPELDKQLCHPVASKKSKACNKVFCSSSSSFRGSSLSNIVQSCQGGFSNVIARKPSMKVMDEASSSSRMIEVSERDQAAQDVSTDHDTKSEIQTLVKINLKLLRGDKNLGFKRYKEVARLATHTIMAACGLKPPPKSSLRFFSGSVCRHAEDVRQHHRSTLMPDSCRECFLVFVKHVVNAIVSEKLG